MKRNLPLVSICFQSLNLTDMAPVQPIKTQTLRSALWQRVRGRQESKKSPNLAHERHKPSRSLKPLSGIYQQKGQGSAGTDWTLLVLGEDGWAVGWVWSTRHRCAGATAATGRWVSLVGEIWPSLGHGRQRRPGHLCKQVSYWDQDSMHL